MRINIPGNLPFSALRLGRDPDGSVSFDTATIEAIEQASDLEPGFFMARPEEALAELIVGWYSQHRAQGGDPDPTAEDLLAEMCAEDKHGGGLSHQPGRA